MYYTSRMSIDDEFRLIKEIQMDPRKFGYLFDLYYKPVFGYIYRRTMLYDESHDIAAETFLKAFLAFPDFRYRGVPISAWIYRIAGNEINQYFRKLKYQPESLNRLLENNETISASFYRSDDMRIIMEEELHKHQEFILIQKSIKTLEIKYQEVISLRYFENKNIKEIANIIGKKEGTVKSLLSRGIEKLRKLITIN